MKPNIDDDIDFLLDQYIQLQKTVCHLQKTMIKILKKLTKK